MSTQTQITSTIRREQMIKRVSFRANLSKELIVGTMNQIVNGDNAICVTKSPKVLEKGIILFFFNSTLTKPPQAGRAYKCVRQ